MPCAERIGSSDHESLMNDECISVIDAASKAGLDKRHVFKILKRLGIETFLSRSATPDHRGQAIAHISLDDLESLRHSLASRTFDSSTPDPEITDAEYIPIEAGVFYLVQLEPESDRGRFKVGFAVNVSERLRSHRCSAPFAVLVKTWSCRRVWERTAIDCVTAGCERLHTEVFRAKDLTAVATRCDQFFSMMPRPNYAPAVDDADAGQSHALDLAVGPVSNDR